MDWLADDDDDEEDTDDDDDDDYDREKGHHDGDDAGKDDRIDYGHGVLSCGRVCNNARCCGALGTLRWG